MFCKLANRLITSHFLHKSVMFAPEMRWKGRKATKDGHQSTTDRRIERSQRRSMQLIRPHRKRISPYRRSLHTFLGGDSNKWKYVWLVSGLNHDRQEAEESH